MVSPDKAACDAWLGNGSEEVGPKSPEKAAHEGGSPVEVEASINKEEAVANQGSQPELDRPDKATTGDRLEVSKSFVMCLLLNQSAVWN